MWDIFLLALFHGGTAHIPGRAITSLLVKYYGISLPDPIYTAGAKWTASCVITGQLVTALHRKAKFRSCDHTLMMG